MWGFNQGASAPKSDDNAGKHWLKRSRWFWGVAAVVGIFIIAATASSGFGGLVVMLGLIAILTGAYTLATARPSWMRMRGRRAGSIALAAGIVATLVGGALLPPTDNPDLTAAAEETAAEEQSEAAAPSPTPTSAPTTPTSAPTPTPEPTKTADVAPLDPDEVTQVDDPDAKAPSEQPDYGGKALALLDTLKVKGRAPKTGYDRDNFGTAWADVDGNGCDTRNDILGDQLTKRTYPAGDTCTVLSGVLADPYTATSIDFLRGEDSSWEVQIDHVVALSDAWQKGARQLSAGQRLAFANDPLNLQATDGPTNSSKGAGDAATWLPPNNSYRCKYVARQISVKSTYGLWITRAEGEAMKRVLSNCSGIKAPTNQESPKPKPEPKPEPAPVQPPQEEPHAPVVPIVPPPAPEPPPAPAPEPPAPAPYYENCTAARDAGGAPVYVGQPGYGTHLDRDGDGVGCES